MHGKIEILLMVVIVYLSFLLVGCLANIKISIKNYEPSKTLQYTLLTIFHISLMAALIYVVFKYQVVCHI